MQEWIKRLFGQFGGDVSKESVDVSVTSDQESMPAVDVEKLVVMAMSTSPDEIDCNEFFEQMDRFVELRLDGEDVAALMPLMQDHLERCRDCREEYEALQRALQALV